MIKKVCDKCGVEINMNPMVNVSFPIYTIYKYFGIPSHFEDIHLCSRCEKLFDRWLNEEEKDDNEDNKEVNNR